MWDCVDLERGEIDSRHDVREVTRLGYGYVLKAVREQLGQEKVLVEDQAAAFHCRRVRPASDT